MWLAEVSAATVANVKHNNCVGLDGKQHSVLMRLVSIKKLAHPEKKLGIFRGEHTALWHLSE